MGVWLNFELSAHKLYFTFQLLSEPLDSREKAGEKGEGRRKEEGFWAGWRCWWGLVGRVGARSWAYRPWKFPLYVSLLFRMGGVWNWTLGGGVGGDGCIGVWGLGNQPATAGSFC